MKTTERHHLKDNELAIALHQAQSWAGSNSTTLTATLAAIVIVGVAVLGYMAWKNNTDDKARTMLAAAMVIEEARVMPPDRRQAPPTIRPRAAASCRARIRPEKAKLEARRRNSRLQPMPIPRMRRADGALSRRQDIVTWAVSTKRSAGTTRDRRRRRSLASARLGKAEAQLRAAQRPGDLQRSSRSSIRCDASLPAEAVLMELARARIALAGNTEEARKTLQQVVEQHADSQHARKQRRSSRRLRVKVEVSVRG
jgi:hypothetical protein